MLTIAVADPGFPVGGDVDSRGGYVLKILYVETKESGPLGGRAPGTPPLDPPMHCIMTDICSLRPLPYLDGFFFILSGRQCRITF